MQKKILFLGGSKFQIPPIIYAKEQGHYVITCDYLPENPGHQFADEYYNISTIDKEAVLSLAKKLKIDGIVAYASDPAAPTQAYVANKMDLPSNPYQSVEILARKDLFRDFLEKYNFLLPKSKSFYKLDEAKEWIEALVFPIIVKPVDSSGSKGVTKIEKKENIKTAFSYALEFSREKKIVIEEFIQKIGYQMDGDIFVVDGRVSIVGYGNQHIDKECNAYVPKGISFPSILNKKIIKKSKEQLERMFQILDIKFGAFNVEFIVNENQEIYFLEVGPRNGGNLIPDTIKYTYRNDTIKYTVDWALGLLNYPIEMNESLGYYSSYLLHSQKNGIIDNIYISKKIAGNIIQKDIFIKEGDIVSKFDGSNHTLGTMIMKFHSNEEMLEKMDNMEKYLKVIIK